MTTQPQPFSINNLLARTRVADLSLRPHRPLQASMTVAAAAAQLREQGRGSAVVCNGSQLLGVFTERDFLKALSAGTGTESPVREVMTPAPQTISAEATLMEAIQLMETGGYRRLPVLDQSGQPQGILDVKLIVHFLVEQIPSTIYNQASYNQLTARSREGA